jgi:hypothetical protein
VNRKDRRAQAARERHGAPVDPRAEAARQQHAKAMVGMELRYGGRTLVVTTYVNTSEEGQEVVRRVQPAARGPRDVMAIVTAHMAPEEPVARLWETQGIQTLFSGRTVVVTAYLNTDEDPQAVSDRVMLAANTPTDAAALAACSGQLAVITTVGELDEADARALWERFFGMLRKQKDGPN